jgi:hypothetical protein
MGVTVEFNYDQWQKRYPEFRTVDPVLAQAYFNEACLYFRNDGTGPVSDPNVQSMLLNMVTAHIAKLNATINGQAPSELVGRINNASEGSVSVGVDNQPLPGSAAWYSQTRYGIAFWQATRQWRTAQYRAYRRPMPSGGAFGGGW